ncbi:hypothetical protein WH95_01570 [Kiloniella litopenaei]|uniref:TRAP transporter small permease protein n=1 Tax=Kiloniella litopenaei TaxID=1549748 RepID=A0A0M2RAV7_9PROT|nr:TRAP transporter small permease [Kiloniella litopenaei]KKJ78781.1 hypothetical protein WH95_01570 [Kiloniella litopenaei]
MRVIDAVSEGSGRIISWLFLCTVFSVFYEVVGRYFFNSPSSWGFEVSLYGSAAAIIIAGAYCTKHQSHIAITTLQEIVPVKARRGLKLFNLLFAAVVCAVMAWATAEWGWKALISWQRTGSAWNPPAPALVKPLIPLSFAMMFLQNIVNLCRVWKGTRDTSINSEIEV